MDEAVSYSAIDTRNIIEEFFIIGVNQISQARSKSVNYLEQNFFVEFLSKAREYNQCYRGEVIFSCPTPPKRFNIQPRVRKSISSNQFQEYLSIQFHHPKRENAK